MRKLLSGIVAVAMITFSVNAFGVWGVGGNVTKIDVNDRVTENVYGATIVFDLDGNNPKFILKLKTNGNVEAFSSNYDKTGDYYDIDIVRSAVDKTTYRYEKTDEVHSYLAIDVSYVYNLEYFNVYGGAGISSLNTFIDYTETIREFSTGNLYGTETGKNSVVARIEPKIEITYNFGVIASYKFVFGTVGYSSDNGTEFGLGIKF